MPLNNNIELRSEEVQEVMNRIPPAIQRWGLTIMIVITGIFISIAFLVKIPITEECQFSVTWEQEGSKPSIKVSLSNATATSVLSKGGAEVRLYSLDFPKELRNTIYTTILSDSIYQNSNGSYSASVKIDAHIVEILSKDRAAIIGSAYVVTSHKTLIDELNTIIPI